MILDVLSILLGLGLLLYCGDLLVRGAVGIARRHNLSPMLIGLTIVAFGTSAPELFVSVHAALKGTGAEGLVLGNVIGSNIANILLVLGVPALIYPTLCEQPAIRRNTLFMVGASFVFLWICLNGDGAVQVWEGALLFVLIITFLAYSAHESRQAKEAAYAEDLEDIENVPTTLPRMLLFIGIAIVGLPLGSHFTVEGALATAEDFGISPAVVGLTIVALGTSLPELATTVMAAFRKHCGVALGNVLGSNMFNILAVMGLASLVAGQPIVVDDRAIVLDLWVMAACALILVPYVFRRWTIGRWSGAAFLTAYGGFLAALVVYVQQA